MVAAALGCMALALSWPRELRAQPEPDADAGVGEPSAREREVPPALTLPKLVSPAALVLPAGAEVPAGGIDVTLALDEQGHVSEVMPRTPVAPDVDAALRDAALALRFEPARRYGTPIAVKIGFRFASPPSASQGQEPAGAGAASAAGSPSAEQPAVPSASATATSATEPKTPPSFGARGRVERPPPGAVSRIKLQGAELREVPGTFGDPLRVVATLPGVGRTPYGLGFFVVRGASFQNTGFFVDDYPVPLLYHLGAGPAIIAPRLVDSLDFYPGGYPVELGRYTAGVIALHTAPPQRTSASLEFEIDALRASGMVVVPLPDERGSIALAVRRSYFELLLPLITNEVSLSYTDYQLRVDLRLTRQLRLSVFFFGSRDTLETRQAAFAANVDSGVSSGLHYAFDQAIVALDWTPSTLFKLRWSGTVSPSLVSFSAGGQSADSVGTDTSALRLGERLAATLHAGAQLDVHTGLDLDVFLATVNAAAPNISELPHIPAPGLPSGRVKVSDAITQLGLAPFVEATWKPAPFELTLGMRAEYLSYAQYAGWLPEPRAVARYAVTPRVILKGGIGLFSQPPLPFQVLRVAGNPHLLPNRALQNSLGVEWQLPWAVQVESNVFYNLMRQLTRSSSEPILDDAKRVRPAFYADDGQGRSYGLELMVRRRVTQGLYGWLSYTLSRSERFLSGGETQVFTFDQTHVLNLAGSYTWGAFRFGARFTLATGRPVQDLLDPSGQSTVFDADANDLDPSVRGRRTRLPTFHQLDVRVDRDFRWGPLSGSVYVDIINVYNAHNGEAYQYEYDFSKRGALPGLPFLPTLGIRGALQ